MGTGRRTGSPDALAGVSIEEKGREILARILRMASGERSGGEVSGRYSGAFAPWRIGATL